MPEAWACAGQGLEHPSQDINLYDMHHSQGIVSDKFRCGTLVETSKNCSLAS